MAKEQYKYTKTHEWIDLSEAGIAHVGISDHAQEQLGDIVYVNLPEVEALVKQGDAIMDVESVKAASDIYTPLDGVVVAVAYELEDTPEKLNASPYETRIFTLKDIVVPEGLLSYEEYLAFLESEED